MPQESLWPGPSFTAAGRKEQGADVMPSFKLIDRPKDDPAYGCSAPPQASYFSRLRNLALLWLMSEHDLAIAEVAGLQWHQVNLVRGEFVRKAEDGLKKAQLPLEGDLLHVLHLWKDCQARGTYYRALEYVFTDQAGKPLSPWSVRLLIAGLLFYTFIPINILPIARVRR